MGINLQERLLRTLEVMGETSAQTSVEGTLELPGNKPAIDRIIDYQAEPEVTEVAVEQDRVIVNGVVSFSALYVAAGQNHSLVPVMWENGLRFNLVTDLAGVELGMDAKAVVEVEDVAWKLESESKIELEVALKANLRVTRIRSTVGIVGVSATPPTDISVQKHLLRVTNIVGANSAAGQVRTALNWPADQVVPITLLYLKPLAKITSVASGADAVTVQGSVDLLGAYIGEIEVTVETKPPADQPEEDAEPTRSIVRQQKLQFINWKDAFTFEKTLEMPGAETGLPAEAAVKIRDFKYTPAGAGNIEVDLEFQAEATVFQPLQLDVLTQISSRTDEEIEVNKQALTLEETIGKGSARVPLAGGMELPASKPGIARILNVSLQYFPGDVEVLAEKVSIEGALDVKVVYSAQVEDGSHPVHFAEFPRALKLAHVLNMPGILPGMKARVEVVPDTVNVVQAEPDTFRVEVALKVAARVSRIWQEEIITEAVVLERQTEDRPSVTMVIAQHGDTLWKLSKRFRTSEEAILATNSHIDPQTLAAGQKIRIPRGA